MGGLLVLRLAPREATIGSRECVVFLAYLAVFFGISPAGKEGLAEMVLQPSAKCSRERDKRAEGGKASIPVHDTILRKAPVGITVAFKTCGFVKATEGGGGEETPHLGRPSVICLFSSFTLRCSFFSFLFLFSPSPFPFTLSPPTICDMRRHRILGWTEEFMEGPSSRQWRS
ncbi:hypothetical protein HOY80DRAFT_966060 [Tuber brumale]|nr:hypothetical protein HOY80DRAFT_966060 [Tuber brumale]